MSRRKPITLYFTEEANLTDEQADEMLRLPGARQRNAALTDPDGPVERADFVAGPAVPANYAKKYPRAEPIGGPAVPAAEEEEEEEEEASNSADMSVAELKAALDEAGVEYPSNAKKAALVALYDANVAE